MPPQPRELSDDLLGEAFLRLPPDDPACLLRASLTCKRWRRILADPAFRRRHRELHGTPSVLGFLRISSGYYASRFVPNNPAASGRPAARDLPGRVVLDCRHGRVLFRAPSPLLGRKLNYDLVVWDPLTNEQRCLPRLSPPLTDVSRGHFNAAVLCSAAVEEGCDHSICHGGPFRVAFIWSQARQLHARLYSSETENWSEAISVQKPPRNPVRLCLRMLLCSKTLVGDTLYFHYSSDYALEYQLGAQSLSIIHGPPRPGSQISAFFVMPMGGGGLGCMDVEEDESSLRLQLWSREAASGSDGVARWTRGRAIDLEELLPNGALPSPRWAPDLRSRLTSVQLLGFAEGTDVIFVGTRAHARNHPGGIYMVQLNSGRARKVSAFDTAPIPFYNEMVVPYTSFCIPGKIYHICS
jgi:hypothetical protein